MPVKASPHQSLAKPMRAAASFWGEPCAHPSQGFSSANQMPKTTPLAPSVRSSRGDK